MNLRVGKYFLINPELLKYSTLIWRSFKKSPRTHLSTIFPKLESITHPPSHSPNSSSRINHLFNAITILALTLGSKHRGCRHSSQEMRPTAVLPSQPGQKKGGCHKCTTSSRCEREQANMSNLTTCDTGPYKTRYSRVCIFQSPCNRVSVSAHVH